MNNNLNKFISIGYQQEPSEDCFIPHKLKFKDTEAQNLRDDVTMQVCSFYF